MASTLSDEELVTVAEIIGEVYQYAQFWVQNLTAAQEISLRADFVTWNSVRDDFTVIDGSGVKIDPADTRRAITRRVRKMLRLDDGGGGSGSVRILRG